MRSGSLERKRPFGQLSDLHRGPMMPRFRVERAVALMAAETPDLIALTGDFVSYWPGYAAEYPEILVPPLRSA